MPMTRPQAQVLDPVDCYRLLAFTCVGRVVTTADALPLVLPVNYCLDGHSIVFRTSPTGRLADATRNVVVAFEVDEVDTACWTGWSVVVIGVATPLESAGDVVRARQLGLVSWLGEDRDHFVRIVPGLVTGRRLHVETLAVVDRLRQGEVRGGAATCSSYPTSGTASRRWRRRRCC